MDDTDSKYLVVTNGKIVFDSVMAWCDAVRRCTDRQRVMVNEALATFGFPNLSRVDPYDVKAYANAHAITTEHGPQMWILIGMLSGQPPMTAEFKRSLIEKNRLYRDMMDRVKTEPIPY